MKDDYKVLLNKFNYLNNSNEEKKNLGVHDYSLMNALLKKTDEVHLHSNFIYSMINPHSNHYCGNIFLKYFLESIYKTKASFINLENARVHKERGKIDLLIEDGEKVIIIENKLRAPDQQYQISRYIKYAIENYLNGDKNNLNEKIYIIYLSEYKDIPSENKKSFIGFKKLNKDSKQLIWDNKKIDLYDSGNLALADDTVLNFKRIQHSKELLHWINLSKEWLMIHRPNKISRSLDYAFDEYKLILKRLNTKGQWRNLMELDEYTYQLGEDENKMYAFMCEANKKLNDYLGKKLFRFIDETYPLDTRKRCILEGKDFKEFNELNCIRWFQKWKTKDKYRDIGFETEIDGVRFVFALGEENIGYGKYPDTYSWDIRTNRQNLQKNEGNNLFHLIDDLKTNYS